jgi:hypothetical protein
MIGTKCVCGYKYGIEYDENSNRIQVGDKEFIYSDLKIPFKSDYHENYKTIIICPKCGTLKIEKY